MNIVIITGASSGMGMEFARQMDAHFSNIDEFVTLMNQFITSLKDTAILSAISVNELTMTSKTIIARNFKAFEVYSYAAIMYIIQRRCSSSSRTPACRPDRALQYALMMER